jgi:hypothetical protein
MTRKGTTCPACGAEASGRFCSACGATLAPGTCASCGASLAASARFCATCGAGASPSRGRRSPTPWAAAAAAVIALAVALFLVARRDGEARAAVISAAPAEASAAGTPPDISQMSPRERFDRLYERSMRASESGDTATVERFAPMALLAYQQLDTIDSDARYHAALLRLHTGDISGAAALGDSILALTPGHLFGYVVGATVGRWRHDEPATKAAYAGFLSHYDAEMEAGRSEYASHKMIMDDMHQRALAAAPARVK